MKTCDTCKHWQDYDNGFYDDILRPRDPDTYEPMELPFDVRMCTSPKLLFCERPVEENGATVRDGSEYKAELLTAAKFGCVLHEDGES